VARLRTGIGLSQVGSLAHALMRFLFLASRQRVRHTRAREPLFLTSLSPLSHDTAPCSQPTRTHARTHTAHSPHTSHSPTPHSPRKRERERESPVESASLVWKSGRLDVSQLTGKIDALRGVRARLCPASSSHIMERLCGSPTL